MNFLQGKIISKGGQLFFSDQGMQIKILKQHQEKLAPYINENVILGMRPEDIYDKLFAQDASDDFIVTGRVELVEPMGSEIYLYFSIGRNNFIVRVSNQDTATVNQDVQVVFDMSKAHFFDSRTEAGIL